MLKAEQAGAAAEAKELENLRATERYPRSHHMGAVGWREAVSCSEVVRGGETVRGGEAQ